tara:strand:- start:39 stop:401 length:363 start_codon:yes stop_codon:yes gene_type:complete
LTSLVAIVFMTISSIANAQPSNIYGNCQSCNLPKPSENWSQRQKQERGMIPTKKYTTCRLKRIMKSKRTGRQACIYLGGNKTYTLMYEDNCPKQYRCVYNPGSVEPNIDDVLDSLNNIKK